ncbi:hypothetical protein D7B24_006204 [Verticillium nonalfalfae]|uniref:JmjC domain-containing protein n=1 Tax=Verticillium nonalfalfae TaxID=1051616 RepID=A0A3M9Y9W0_9PEZI|nr:uncharacterized protein D7B24_006204 [Verticillium nonalfalfae]RNJ57297.1 hypothetical protein D7B24_006204 [Verticillium nonalfalfae]
MEAMRSSRDALMVKCKVTVTDIGLDAHKRSSMPTGSPAGQGLLALPKEVLETLGRLAADTLALRAFSPTNSLGSRGDALELLERLDQELDRTYKKFYEFVYQDLPYCWRQLYTDLSLLKLSCLVASSPLHEPTNPASDGPASTLLSDCDLNQAVKALDKALILAGGAGITRGRQSVECFLQLLEDAAVDHTKSDNNSETRPSKRPRLDTGPSCSGSWDSERSFPQSRIFEPDLRHPVENFRQISMQKFQQYMDEGTSRGPNGLLPFVVKGLMDDWPAMTTRPWRKPEYLLSRTFGGRRLVPVEVGRTYVDEGWGQELITFRELLDRLECPEAPNKSEVRDDDIQKKTTESIDPKPVSYLAQHELFTQLPVLRNDIPTPDLCYTSPPPHPLSRELDKPETPLPLINAWLGPAGTITPLHTDAYHNLLAQVVGAKYVRLYSPHDTEALCPRGEDDQGIDMHNTSAFDVGVIEGWDELPDGEEARDAIELEEFRSLKYWECILEEGDMLYIPIGWWHYVRSLSVSFSVSFWWNGDHFIANDGSAAEDSA